MVADSEQGLKQSSSSPGFRQQYSWKPSPVRDLHENDSSQEIEERENIPIYRI